MVPMLVSVALDCYRDPRAYRHLNATHLPLPMGFGALLTDLCSALAPGRAEETARLTGFAVAELHAAARFFVRQLLLPSGADHYRCLGLRPDASAATVRRHYRLLIGLFHPDREDGLSTDDASLAARLNAAYRTLRDDDSRALYDARRPRLAAAEQPADPAALFRRRSDAPMAIAASSACMRLPPPTSSSQLRRSPWLIALLTGLIVTLLFIAIPRTPKLRAYREVPAPPPVPAYLTDATQALLIAPIPRPAGSWPKRSRRSTAGAATVSDTPPAELSGD